MHLFMPNKSLGFLEKIHEHYEDLFSINSLVLARLCPKSKRWRLPHSIEGVAVSLWKSDHYMSSSNFSRPSLGIQIVCPDSKSENPLLPLPVN